MKQRITQAALMLILLTAIASAGKECPPKSMKPISFTPEKLIGSYRLTYCFGKYPCPYVKCSDCSYKNLNEKEKKLDVFISSVNVSTGKLEQLNGILTVTAPDEYTICGLKGVPCTNRFFHLAQKEEYVIKFACIQDEKGEIDEVSFIGIGNDVKLLDSYLPEIKEVLIANGLKIEDYKELDEKGCKGLE